MWMCWYFTMILICLSYWGTDVERHVLIGHSHFFFSEVSFQVFVHFSYAVYIIELYEFFKYSHTSHMADICLGNIFLPVCDLTFPFLNDFF